MKKKFVTGGTYHIFNKSIAGFGIFKGIKNSRRFYETLDYYNNINPKISLSAYIIRNGSYEVESTLYPRNEAIVKFISYIIMPDHYHLLVRLLESILVSQYLSNLENSFSRYFNIRFKRKGPLWQSRFKSVQIKNNEQLLHVSRYIHLNPTTAGLVDKPEDWEFSSYREVINDDNLLKNVLAEISINNPRFYKKFVENNKDYQAKLARIKKLTFE